MLYFRIGKMIFAKIEKASWGSKVLNKISTDLQQELPGIRGFSSQNLKKMQSFYKEWKQYF